MPLASHLVADVRPARFIALVAAPLLHSIPARRDRPRDLSHGYRSRKKEERTTGENDENGQSDLRFDATTGVATRASVFRTRGTGVTSTGTAVVRLRGDTDRERGPG